MASAGSTSPCDELLCSICLDVFAQPVSTPCGHNYCKPCITDYWASSGQAQCPLCKEKFGTQPKLRVNTEFRDMVEHFNNRTLRAEGGVPVKPGEIPCDICVRPKMRAEKTCLVCLASYCHPHLEPHQRVATFQQHKLIDPVANMEDRVCTRHNKVFELFCHTDGVCVCLMCLSDDHAQHRAEPLEQAFGEKKQQLAEELMKMKATETSKTRLVKKCKYSMRKNNWKLKKQIAEIDEAFAALVASLQQSRTQLVEAVEEKHSADKKKSEEHLVRLRQEVAQLKKDSAEAGRLLQMEDHHQFLRSWPALSVLARSQDPLDPQPASVDASRECLSQFGAGYGTMVSKAVSEMKETLAEDMEALIEEVRSCDGGEAAAEDGQREPDVLIEEPLTPSENALTADQLCNAVDITFNARTANHKLAVYEEGKCLGLKLCRAPECTYTSSKQFSYLPCVLGQEGFSSGKFYFQVDVGQSTGWLVGVVRESVDLNIAEGPYPEWGGYTVCGFFDQFNQFCFANTCSCEALNVRPQTIGVFVDYEKGEVFFYDVGSRTRFLSYTNCTFNEPAPMLKSFIYSMAGTSVGNTKLFPIFGFYGHSLDECLTISPVGSEV